MTSPGALLYMKGDIEKGEIKFYSIGSGLVTKEIKEEEQLLLEQIFL